MRGPLVSVIMLSYNNVQFLKAAIDSVKAQTYKNWELIIADDCSTDGAFELALILARRNKRIRVVRSEARQGIPKNRTMAYGYTTGEFISHLDGDDMLFPTAIEESVAALLDNINLGLVYTDSAFVDATGKVTQYVCNDGGDLGFAHLGWRHFGTYRRSAYECTNGYNFKLKSACEDGDLFMQIAEKFPIAKVPTVLYKHRWHGKNASDTNAKCETCTDRPICNYIRVWAKAVGYDPITYTPLKDITNE